MNLPNDDLELYAEQALFAALHTRPDHVPGIAKLLRPDDFADATHREHYRHLTNQPTSGTAPHQAQSLSAERCPNPDHAPAYARMVLAASIRRDLARHTTRLATTARVEAAGNLGTTNTLAATHELTKALQRATHRWGTTGPRPNHLPAPTTPAVSPPTQQDDEAQLLASLTSHPQHIPAITRRLHPEDFTNPRHQLLYRSLATLHHRGEPIDPLTLAWEARHHGAPAHHLTIDHITTLTTDDPHQRADRLLEAAFRRTASDAGQIINTLTADPTLTTGDLLASGGLALQPVMHLYRRWRAPHHTTEQLHTGPTALARTPRGQAA
ncbi:DnaB-like helicase N-terminal domain-containing protein [Streptomyces sp. NPDC127098]|uniref:DnaB-like helicase N-terminal domain-containing protein n=1 Tax=Streptomyces sp. NPDC127098 TaxID=3347137 RepID=UPI0036471C9A